MKPLESIVLFHMLVHLKSNFLLLKKKKRNLISYQSQQNIDKTSKLANIKFNDYEVTP